MHNYQKNLADAVVMINKNRYWVKSSVMRNINTFTNDIIKINGVITITVKLNDWTTEDIKVTVVEN